MLKIKYLLYNEACKIEQHGEWIDLKTSKDVHLTSPKVIVDVITGSQTIVFDKQIIPTSMVIMLPKGLEMHIVPRSSTFKKYGLIQTNHLGVIDNAYCGPKDIIGLPVMAIGETFIPMGTRLCQFKIVPSQSASWWVKLKYLFTRITADSLIRVAFSDNNNRGGFGQSGL